MKVSYIIQYFNHRDNIIPMTDSLVGLYDGTVENEEIIFHNDSNSDHDIFNQLKDKYKQFSTIESDDIHEIRGYNKCIQKATGDYIVLMQDDDIIEKDDWLKNCMILFEKFEDLAIIGCYCGGILPWNQFYMHKIQNNDIQYKFNDIVFEFVSWLNLGPFIIRKKH